LDHAGINLPWFSQGLHPVIQSLREALAASCLYHQFPSGEPWDFIIPGDVEEIRQVKPVEYNTTRRPKFELVSFETDSKPLVQFDLGVDAGYEVFQPLFPEALNDPQFHNIWIYLENPLPLDVCLVINQFGSADWSPFFKDSRL